MVKKRKTFRFNQSKKKRKRRLKPVIKRRLKMLAVLVTLLFLGLWIRRNLMMQAEQKAFAKADRSAFVEIVGKTAEDLAHQHDLYASVMVAQAILESDWGQSQLTKEANNLFGIKGDYWGQFYEIETAEDDGTGNLYTVVARFRKYPTYHASLKDNANLLSKGLAGAPDFYVGAWKSQTGSYQEATDYLQGRYATDTSYASKLNALIEQYDLTRFDR
ncbi:glucosaminidase domain-containing protein [Streptococcus merionis]|uniref:Peptidoglycan hydrolase n=1 Tax=Streptococcus merionis TaxID=400065 RepID=A0A239STF9_9STRE|nr:glucosaminidase domain-containing protein [Streptococcus merionis]SNU88532.1 peptidoglycan hydrolase [Streptococcus merionis]